MALVSKSTIIYTLITVILAIIYPFYEWRASLNKYKESKIDNDFNKQLYGIIHGAKYFGRNIAAMPIHKISKQNEEKIGFNLLSAQYSAILSNYIYIINHDTFQFSKDASIKESLSESPHNFPSGFNLLYLQLRSENDVNIKWALFEHTSTNTKYLVLCGTDFLIDILIDISFNPLPLTYSPADISNSKSWRSMFRSKRHDFLDNFLVHGGIGGAMQWLTSNITSVLDETLIKNQKLIICGHSLGAGYATVLAMRLLTLYKKMNAFNINLKLFTFGSPAVLSIVDSMDVNNSYSKHPTLQRLNENTFNFVNRFDVVPRLLGEQFEELYPKFLWTDDLLLNQIKSFKPIGNYYILHDKNRILYNIDAKNHDLLSTKILKIIPKALFNDKNDARTKLVLMIFRFLFGQRYSEYIDYLLWLSFSAHPLITDHSMDKYLSLLGDFSSQISYNRDGVSFCLNSALQFEVCDDEKDGERKKNDRQWRVTQYGQLQNVRTKECIFMDWKLENVFSWSFKYEFTKTLECSIKLTTFKYLNQYKMFKILSDERIDDYDSVDAMELMHIEQDLEELKNDSVIDLNGICLGCNLTANRLDVYQCNKSYQDVETIFHFSPHTIASNEKMSIRMKEGEGQQKDKMEPKWVWWHLFDEYL